MKFSQRINFELVNNLPFGLSISPELFQSRMNKILQELEGVLCHMDDVLRNLAEPNTRLDAALLRLQTAGVTPNADKCTFFKDSVRFLGHIINKHGCFYAVTMGLNTPLMRSRDLQILMGSSITPAVPGIPKETHWLRGWSRLPNGY